MDSRIIKFIEEQTCMSMSYVDGEGNPHVFNCFYAFDAASGHIYFKSSEHTMHIKIMLEHPAVAGSILPNALNPLKAKGIQLEGERVDDAERSLHGKKVYYQRHPLAMAKSGNIWCIRINAIKMTDNTFMFGEKILWEREQIAAGHAEQ